MPPASPALAGRVFTTEPARKPPSKAYVPVFLHFGMGGWEGGRGTAAVADGLMAFLVYWNGKRHILFTGVAGIFFCPQQLLFVINLTETWEASLAQFVLQHYEFSFLVKPRTSHF